MINKNFKDTCNSEDFDEEVISKLKGIRVLIQALGCADEAGSHIYQKQAYAVLSDMLMNVIKETEDYQVLISELDNQIKNLKKEKR